ncbi:hypothetical protein L6452_27986 [Arctium lappa]|uniref:Uncharacterized protein n=1 Tax=Arctium lappa TaxID=4217 RepID=A0ACB8ZY01_ARCLA|nr:hypothetical protein L6452_27986 [Arctium lappa]
MLTTRRAMVVGDDGYWRRWLLVASFQVYGEETRKILTILAGNQDFSTTPIENVIFLHRFLSSSFLWTKTVFPQLAGSKYRLFAVDLLGFGSSPKPRDYLYTMNDHLEMVEKSVIREFNLTSFHLVAHSMGCMIALALAAKHPNNLKSITLTAPMCVLRFVSEPQDMGTDFETRYSQKEAAFPSDRLDEAHSSFGLAHDAQCDLQTMLIT